MANKAHPATYDQLNLDIDFYEGYDANFLFNKVQTLWAIVQEPERFQHFIDESKVISGTIDHKCLDSLRAEIYFTEFHQFESFFALLNAIYHEPPHWLYLTTYRPGDMRKKAELFLKRDITTLTLGRMADLYTYLEHAIYCDGRPSEDNARNSWQMNLDNIAWLIDQMATRYLDASRYGAQYNAYKHGLRVVVGESRLSIKVTGSDNPATTFGSVDSVSFLEVKDNDGGEGEVYRRTIHFSPEISHFYLQVMKMLLQMIRDLRLWSLYQIRGDDLSLKEAPKLLGYSDLDRRQLSQIDTHLQWTFSV